MSSNRSSLLGHYQQENNASPPDTFQSAARRGPLLQNAPPSLIAPQQPPRRTILGDPASSPSAPIFSTGIATPEPVFTVPSILDRAVGLLDRTEAEKQQLAPTSFSGGNVGAPLLPAPATSDQDVFGLGMLQVSVQHHGNIERADNIRRGLLDRGPLDGLRTISPHSIRSSSPGITWTEESQSKIKNVLPIPAISASIIPTRPGLLDRVSPPVPLSNGSSDMWSSLYDRLARAPDGSTRDRAGGALQYGRDSRRDSRRRSDSRSSSQSRSRLGRRGIDEKRRNCRSRSPTFRLRDKNSRSQSKNRTPDRNRSCERRRSRSRGGNRNRDSTHRQRSRSPDLRNRNQRDNREHHSDSRQKTPDAKDKDNGQIPVKCGILDRTLEEKASDASLQAAVTSHLATDGNVNVQHASGLLGNEKSQSSKEPVKTNGADSMSNEPSTGSDNEKNPRDEQEKEVSCPPRIPTGYRRMCVRVTKLLPLELKLISNWRYCKFIANSPCVHLTRLPEEVVEAVQRRYAAEDEQKRKELKQKNEAGKPLGKTHVENQLSKLRTMPPGLDTTSSAGSKTDKSTSQVAKRTKPLRQRDPAAAPFLNIPGMPSLGSLWSIKIKKKIPAEQVKEEAAKKNTTGSWQKLPSKISATDPKNSGSSVHTTKRRISATSGSALVKSETEYVSPLMQIEAENAAKRAREVRQRSENRREARTSKEESAVQPMPLMDLKVEPGTRATSLLPVPTISPAAASTRPRPTSPALSSSSHSSLWTDMPGTKGPTPPPATHTAFMPRERRALLGIAPLPLLPTPIIGPRTPSHSPPNSDPLPRRGVPLLGDQPPVLPNWEPDPPRSGLLQRPALLEEPQQPTESQLVDQEPPSQVVMADGTIFDPMMFLNRDSDYSSDSDTPAPIGYVQHDNEKHLENQQLAASASNTPGQVDDFLKIATTDDGWTPAEASDQTDEKSSTNAGTVATAVPNNADLESEAEMAILAFRLVANLEKQSNAGSASGAPNPIEALVGPQSAPPPKREEEDDYGISQLRSIIQQFLDDPLSILQTDLEERRKALELLPVLDELEAFARARPGAINSALIMPIMQFVQQIVELSSPDMGIPAATVAEMDSGIISHTVVENLPVTKSSPSTPM